jgi:hypothetical protein
LDESDTPDGALQVFAAVLNVDQAALRLVFNVAVADFTDLLKSAQAVFTPTCTVFVVVFEYAPANSVARVAYAAEIALACVVTAASIAASRVATAVPTQAILVAVVAAVVVAVVCAKTGDVSNVNANNIPETVRIFLIIVFLI